MKGATVCVINEVAASNKTTNFIRSIMEHNKDHKSNTGPHTRQEGHVRLRCPLVRRDEGSRFLATILQFPRGE
jgi:hypothetical protein